MLNFKKVELPVGYRGGYKNEEKVMTKYWELESHICYWNWCLVMDFWRKKILLSYWIVLKECLNTISEKDLIIFIALILVWKTFYHGEANNSWRRYRYLRKSHDMFYHNSSHFKLTKDLGGKYKFLFFVNSKRIYW